MTNSFNIKWIYLQYKTVLLQLLNHCVLRQSIVGVVVIGREVAFSVAVRGGNTCKTLASAFIWDSYGEMAAIGRVCFGLGLLHLVLFFFELLVNICSSSSSSSSARLGTGLLSDAPRRATSIFSKARTATNGALRNLWNEMN